MSQMGLNWNQVESTTTILSYWHHLCLLLLPEVGDVGCICCFILFEAFGLDHFAGLSALYLSSSEQLWSFPQHRSPTATASSAGNSTTVDSTTFGSSGSNPSALRQFSFRRSSSVRLPFESGAAAGADHFYSKRASSLLVL